MDRYLYCKEGKHYPSTILEVYDSATQRREWDEEKGKYIEVAEAMEMGESLLFCPEHACSLIDKKGDADVQDNVSPRH